MVGTPMYGGQCYHNYVKGLLDFQALCLGYGVEMQYSIITNASLVHTARNSLVDQFLESDCTHLAFIAADVGFKGIELLALLACNKGVIGGSYSRKLINWDNVKTIASLNPSISSDDLEKVIGDFPVMLEDDSSESVINEIVKVRGTGTGLMIIERSVFEQFKNAYPEFEHHPNDAESLSKNKMGYAYFTTGITEIEKNGETIRVDMGEDYRFCLYCRKIGIDIWYAPFTNTTHMGSYEYKGNIGEWVRLLHEATNG